MNMRQTLGLKSTIDSIIYHEAGHALVGYKVGMRLVFADMTGLTVGCPVVGLDVEPVAFARRPQARAMAALAGPLAEASVNSGIYNWRQDGKVAEIAAKALVQDDIEKRSVLLIKWATETRTILEQNKAALMKIYMALNGRALLDGDELTDLVAEACKHSAEAVVVSGN
jgi:hypothetical protein